MVNDEAQSGRTPYTIYVCTCRPTGKSYVGQTTQSLHARWEGHVREANEYKSRQLYAAIQKYDADVFDLKIVETCRTQAEANTAERVWIAKLNTLSPHGFNMRAGGARKQHKRAHKLRCNPTSITFDRPQDLEMVRRAARHSGKSLSRFLREVALQQAREILAAAHQACPHCGVVTEVSAA